MKTLMSTMDGPTIIQSSTYVNIIMNFSMCKHGSIVDGLKYLLTSIIVVPSKVDIDASIQSMKNRPEKIVLTDEWYINKLLGIEIIHIDEKIVKVSQSFLIYRIISLLNIDTH